MTMKPYPIGTPGKAWGAEERKLWLESTTMVREYREEVLGRVSALADRFEVRKYGALAYDAERYPLYAVLPQQWRDELPIALVTGGVHGYEIGGVYGALEFLETVAGDYMEAFNVVVAPCVSPWGFETCNRWNPYAVDPNRSFVAGDVAEESSLLMRFVQSLPGEFAVHIDLHETTDTDLTTFRPALAARDGLSLEREEIPQGFYNVADEGRDDLEFQVAVIAAVEQITRIAPVDEAGHILGKPPIAHGVIEYPMTAIGLCGSITTAPYHTTTEVYPDGDWVTQDICVKAQVAAVTGGLGYVANVLAESR